jgi:hypothetical protein
VLFLAAGRDRGHGAAVERALEGDDPEALRLAALEMEAARHLDRAFDRLGTGVAEERRVGEGVGDQTLGELLLQVDGVEVGAVPELLGLRLQGPHEMGMAVAEQGHRHAAAEIQVSSAVAVEKIGTLAALEGDRGALVDRQKGGNRSVGHLGRVFLTGKPATWWDRGALSTAAPAQARAERRRLRRLRCSAVFGPGEAQAGRTVTTRTS